MDDFPIDLVRAQFPALSLSDDGRPRVYFDGPAGTQVPQRVVDAMAECLIRSNANLGGDFVTSIRSESVVVEAHRAMARFLGAQSEREVIVGPSMTALTFMLSRSLAPMFERGDELIVTQMDHDANIAPWLMLAQERGAIVRWLPFDTQTWVIEDADLEPLLNAKTRLVALNYASNLTGSINNVKSLVAKARAAGVLTYVDAVQYAPHAAIDVAAVGCDFLSCSSYKFFGPHLGILWGREALLNDLRAYKVRPMSDALPYRFETGTPQIESLAGLLATVEYFEWLGTMHAPSGGQRELIAAAFDMIGAYENSLAWRLIEGLEALPGVVIQGISDPQRSNSRLSTISFTHGTVLPGPISQALAAQNIFVWAGHNFALEVVRRLGIDEATGVLRIGLEHYNTAEEVDRMLRALRKILTPLP